MQGFILKTIDQDSHRIEPRLLQRYLQTTYESKRLYVHFHALRAFICGICGTGREYCNFA